MLNHREKTEKTSATFRLTACPASAEQLNALRLPERNFPQLPASEVLELRRDRFVLSDKLSMLIDAALTFNLAPTFADRLRADPVKAIETLFRQAHRHDAGKAYPMALCAEPGAAHRAFLAAAIPAWRPGFSPDQAGKFVARLKPGVILLSKTSLVDPLRLVIIAHEERHRALVLLAGRQKNLRNCFREAFTAVMKVLAKTSVIPAQLVYFKDSAQSHSWEALVREGLGSNFEAEEFFNRCFDLNFRYYQEDYNQHMEADSAHGLLPALACRMALAEASRDPALRQSSALRLTLQTFARIRARALADAVLDIRALPLCCGDQHL